MAGKGTKIKINNKMAQYIDPLQYSKAPAIYFHNAY